MVQLCDHYELVGSSSDAEETMESIPAVLPEANDRLSLVGSGNGLKNMKKRVDETGGNIRFNTEAGMRLQVEVVIP